MYSNSSFMRPGGCVRLRYMVALFVVGLAVAASAQDVLHTFFKGPYLQAPGADTMTIMWESPTNKPGIVHYGLNDQIDRGLRLERPSELLAVTNYSVTNITAKGETNVIKVSLTNAVFLYEMTLTHLQ